MEYFWYILAALGAGVGTGLAGLSAATVMVPILIVLCPSFAGETGAYQATAIALASDILGSAVTTATYIRYRNIDLRRGWIMLACIVSMCTVGSFAAWLAGNVVLGGFTLLLTFCIGIRFLVKPDTTRKNPAAKGSRLDWKDVLISLFFGLTIGFGTGFVGTGGGMMMLVVFTAFLGMELKPAVGTSTFIMTFTALIASVSHILIHPAIVLEKWNVMALCIPVATAASLISARFANRFSSRTVGLVTGGVLTVLGGAMILLHYWNVIAGSAWILGTIGSLLRFLLVIASCALILIAVRAAVRIPNPIFRKLLHMTAFGCSAYLVVIAEQWYCAGLAMLLFAAAIYPILALVEHSPWYDGLFVQKQPGEVKKSLLLLFAGEAVVCAIGWGGTGEKAVAVAAILMWGFGDEAAALVGIYFGKHPVRWSIADGKKTWEGFCAMAVTALLSGMITLAVMTDAPVWQILTAVLPTALVAALTELVSKGGNDTVTVPLATVSVLSLITLIVSAGMG